MKGVQGQPKLLQGAQEIEDDRQFRFSGGTNERSGAKPTQPSPFVQAFMKSTFKQGAPGLDESLDKLQREFFNNYNEVMGISEAKDVKPNNAFQSQNKNNKDQTLQFEKEML